MAVRCDQEDVIERLQHGIAGMRMPTRGLHSNAVFLNCARLAQDPKAWLARRGRAPRSVGERREPPGSLIIAVWPVT